MRRTEELIKALKRVSVTTGSIVCLGCGREHGCSVHGCAILREAATALEALEHSEEPTQCSADVAPVVRCRDCEHSWDDVDGLVCSYGPLVDCIVPGDYGCVYGERRENDGK